MPSTDLETTDDEVNELLLDLEKAPPKTDGLKLKEIIHRGDDDLPFSVVVSALEEAGYVYVYDTVTRERSICSRNNLGDVLRKKREDGTRVYTTRKPKEKPWRGTFKCLLHPDQAERGHYDGLGLPVCMKANMPNAYQVQLHMAHRHPSALKAIEEEKAEKEKEEEREWQRNLMATVAGVDKHT